MLTGHEELESAEEAGNASRLLAHLQAGLLKHFAGVVEDGWLSCDLLEENQGQADE